jgi:D-aminoacyl-tRNA deacylase
MRVLVQRVSRGEVRIRDDGGAVGSVRVAGRIGSGFVLLVGFTHGDGEPELRWMADKVIGLRLFGDDEGKMNRSLGEVRGALLVVSQFTLYGEAGRGRRPSFIDAARPEVATPLYERFLAMLRGSGLEVAAGEFGASMEVELVNDGPVTLWLERQPSAAAASPLVPDGT